MIDLINYEDLRGMFLEYYPADSKSHMLMRDIVKMVNDKYEKELESLGKENQSLRDMVRAQIRGEAGL